MRLDALIISISHDHLHSFKVFSRGSYPLHQLQIFALHVLVPLHILVVLEGQLQHFLACSSLSLRCFLPVLFVHVEAGLCLGCCRSHITIVLVNLLNVFLILLRLLFLVGPQPLDLSLKLFFARPKAIDL